MAELPIIENLTKDKDIEELKMNFLFASDEKKEKLLNFTNKRNLKLNFCTIPKKLPEEFSHQSIPVTFIIDNQKK